MPTKKPTLKLRNQVAERGNHRCEYCQSLKSYSPSPFNLEHIIPLSQGGLTILENLAFSCYGCNRKKSDKLVFLDPLNGESVRCFNPRTDDWTTHFVWSEVDFLVIGITAIGRAAVEALDLNRKELLNLRRVLAMIELHPP